MNARGEQAPGKPDERVSAYTGMVTQFQATRLAWPVGALGDRLVGKGAEVGAEGAPLVTVYVR